MLQQNVNILTKRSADILLHWHLKLLGRNYFVQFVEFGTSQGLQLKSVRQKLNVTYFIYYNSHLFIHQVITDDGDQVMNSLYSQVPLLYHTYIIACTLEV